MKTVPDTTLHTPLDALFKRRFGGAVNIRGIRYQLLYSIRLALRLYDEDAKGTTVQLEGIEDVDLRGLHLGDEYVQVKTADTPWNWARLRKPVTSFLEVLRAEPESHFVLAVDFVPRGDVATLAACATLPPAQQAAMQRKFRRLCREMGGSEAEADRLLARLRISSQPEAELWAELRRTLVEAWGLGSEAVDTYLAALVARFLQWAAERASIRRADLDGVRAAVGEALAREAAFQAYGSGFVSRVTWAPDREADDFLDGKATRPGHVSAGLDVLRPLWLDRIDQAVSTTGICILRSSSGQGKSALLFRYAFGRWPHSGTFVLRIAESPEQVELVRNYLRFRAEAGLLTYLLIDDAGLATRLWPAVAQACAALGVPVLVSMRNEDWYRFVRWSTTSYEVLDPRLDMEEARQLFATFRAAGRLHPTVDSAEWAYERIGEPHLLIEYVYLLTHGHMLEERLRDQVAQFEDLKEDPAKVEILRRVALAHALGVPVRAAQLLQGVPLSSDPLRLLQSLDGEYVVLGDGLLTGLHWVRSDHLVAILHEGYPELAATALAVFDAVPPEYWPAFVANALTRDDLDQEAFLQGLDERAATASMVTIVALLDGLYEAGERQFLRANRANFDEAYALLGSSGTYLLSTILAPVIRVDALRELAQNGESWTELLRQLSALADRAMAVPRGLDLCRRFLERAEARMDTPRLCSDSGAIGRLLDWCSLTGVRLSSWPDARDTLVSDRRVFSVSLDDFCAFAQGLYRYDEPTYRRWLEEWRHDIFGYLRLHTDTLALEVTDDVTSIQFVVDSTGGVSANEQAMSRLRALRATLPFCERYRAQGEWLLPLGLTPSVNDARKDIAKENLPLPSDAEKNGVWGRSVQAQYLPDSYYRYQESWHGLRVDALRFVETLAGGLQRTLVRKGFDFHVALERGELPVRLAQRLQHYPDPPPQTPEVIVKVVKETTREWVAAFDTFFRQLLTYLGNGADEHVSQVVVFNFREAATRLLGLHAAFAQLDSVAPDYFGIHALDAKELRACALLGELLEIWLIDPPKLPQRDILRYVRQRQERRQQHALARLAEIADPLRARGIDTVLPNGLHIQHPFRSLVLAYEVADPCHPERELAAVADALATVADAADFFWLVPIHGGKRFIPDGHSFSARQLTGEAEELTWETLVPRDVPEAILDMLPPIPVEPRAEIELREELLGVLNAAEVLTSWRRRVGELVQGQDEYEGQLRKRQLEKLAAADQELLAAAERARAGLHALLGPDSDNSDYLAVVNFLERLRDGARMGDGLSEPDRQAAAEMVEALERLTCRRELC